MLTGLTEHSADKFFKQVFSTGLPTFKSGRSCFAMKTAILIFDGCPCLDVLHSKYSVVLSLYLA